MSESVSPVPGRVPSAAAPVAVRVLVVEGDPRHRARIVTKRLLSQNVPAHVFVVRYRVRSEADFDYFA